MTDEIYLGYGYEYKRIAWRLGPESASKWEYKPAQGGGDGYEAGLPPGIAADLDQMIDGVIFSGTPTQSGHYQAVFDTNTILGQTTSKAYVKFFVAAINIQASSVLPQKLTVGQKIVPITITAFGGTEPYTYKEQLGLLPETILTGKMKHFLPPGLSFNPATRTLSGAPTTKGVFEFWLGATDVHNIGGHSTGSNGWKYFKVEVESRITLTGTPHRGIVGEAYSDKITASGGSSPYTYVSGRSAKELGVAIESRTGELTWTPTSPGPHSFWLGARDSDGSGAHDSEGGSQANGWLKYDVTVDKKVTTLHVGVSQTPPDWVMGDKYPNIEIVASGGAAPYTYRAEGTEEEQEVPPGLAVDGAMFSGTPTKDGDYSLRFVATDKDGNSAHVDFHVTIFPRLNGEFDGDDHATVGVEYKGKVYSYGGYPPARLEMELPEGLRLEPYVEERDPHKDHSRARVVGKPTKALVDFQMKPYAIDSKGNRAALLAEPDKLTVAPGKPGGADLALGKLLRGHFALASGSGGETLTITGEVSGGGLSESNRPAFVSLQIKQPGQSTFVDAKTIGKLEWATNWKADGWEFTLSGIKWSAQKGVPRFEIQAKLDSHTSKSAIVRFPLSEFVKNLAFQDSDGEPLSGTQLTVKPGPQTLHLHMAFYNAIDQLTAKLALPDGITGKALLPAVTAALPKSLKVRSDWNGHTQPVVFEISKENPLKIASGSHQTVNLSIPVDVATTFRSGEAKCELSSSSESVENVPNDTKPERTALSLLASTS